MARADKKGWSKLIKFAEKARHEDGFLVNIHMARKRCEAAVARAEEEQRRIKRKEEQW